MKRLLLLAALLLSAYGSAGAPASASASPYVGTWSARLSSAQMINQGLDPRLAGRFRLVLRRNDTYTSFNSLDGASQGRFTVSGRTDRVLRRRRMQGRRTRQEGRVHVVHCSRPTASDDGHRRRRCLRRTLADVDLPAMETKLGGRKL